MFYLRDILLCMKESLFLPVIFLLSCIAIIIVGALGYTTFFSTSNMIVGTENTVNLGDLFLRGAIFVFPFAMVFSCLIMIFFMIRHPQNIGLSIAIYFIICLIVWILLIPLSVKIEEKTNTIFVLPSDNVELSQGYFRNEDSGLFFYTDNSALYISSLVPKKQTVNDYIKDPLIAQNITVTPFLSFVYKLLIGIRNNLKNCVYGGFSDYCGFFSMGLALIMLFALRHASSWKLLNLCFVFFGFFVIIVVNQLVIYSNILENVQMYLISRGFSLAAYKNFFPFIINGLFFLILLTIEIINDIKQKRRRFGDS